MTLVDAVRIFERKYSDKKIIAAYEYDSLFVFSAVSKDAKVASEEVFDCQTAVDKKTEKTFTFQPWDISVDEYNRGRKVM